MSNRTWQFTDALAKRILKRLSDSPRYAQGYVTLRDLDEACRAEKVGSVSSASDSFVGWCGQHGHDDVVRTLLRNAMHERKESRNAIELLSRGMRAVFDRADGIDAPWTPYEDED